MKLVRTVNSTYNEVDRNMRILEQEGVLTQRYAGRKRIIRLNFKNERTLILLKLLQIRENTADLKQFRKELKRLIENVKESNGSSK